MRALAQAGSQRTQRRPDANDRLLNRTSGPIRRADRLALLDDGTLDERKALATAVIVALGTDALAERTDILPDPDRTDRAGWWGDLDASEIWGGWPIGSRLWLLKRDKIEDHGAARGATVTRVDRYIREALQPLVDRRIASTFDVKASRVGRERSMRGSRFIGVRQSASSFAIKSSGPNS